MKFLSFMMRKHPVASLLLGICLAGLAWFTFSIVRDALYWSDPAHQEQDLQPWMTPGYVGKSWDLPPPVIGEIMDVKKGQRQPTLRHVTRHLGISMEELQSRVEAAKAEQDRLKREHHDPHKGPDKEHGKGSPESKGDPKS